MNTQSHELRRHCTCAIGLSLRVTATLDDQRGEKNVQWGTGSIRASNRSQAIYILLRHMSRDQSPKPRYEQ